MFATIEVKMFDWIVFALRHAFESVLFSALIVIVALALILGLVGWMWGKLWNRKWNSLLTSPTDFFVCFVVALLFCIASLALHGLSGQNFGAGLQANGRTPYDKDAIVAIPSESVSLGLEKNAKSDNRKTAYNLILDQQSKRWPEGDAASSGRALMLAFLSSLLPDDPALRDICQSFDGLPEYTADAPATWAGASDLQDAATRYASWNDSFNRVAENMMEHYRGAARFLTVLWWILLLFMAAWTAVRAFIGIRVNPPSADNTPTPGVEQWANEPADENADR